jgi:hypothetical protein
MKITRLDASDDLHHFRAAVGELEYNRMYGCRLSVPSLYWQSTVIGDGDNFEGIFKRWQQKLQLPQPSPLSLQLH